MLNAHTLFAAQLIAHMGLLYFFFVGSLSQWTIVLLVYFLSGCIGMTATYHRLLSHRSWNCPKWIEYLGVLLATIGMTGSAIAWSAVHRKHHRFVETARDPHSPSHHGFIYCQWFTMFESPELKYVPDMLRDKFYQFQHRHYFTIILLYAAVLWVLDPAALLYAWLVPAAILWNGGSAINTFAHLFGKNENHLDCGARNNWVLGYLMWGEGWHNNHHYDSKNKSFSQRWWQIDIGYFYILAVEKIFADSADIHHRSQ